MNDVGNQLDTVIQFLNELERNNNRQWFLENREKYDSAKLVFEQFVANLLQEIVSFDSEIIPEKPSKYIFRIYRDTRFSKDKDPYKNNFGAFISPAGRSGGLAGYYIHIESGKSMAAGGVYMPQPEVLKAIRTEVLFKHELFSQLINEPPFVQLFGGLDDIALSRPPKGFPPDHPAIHLARYKSYVYTRMFDDSAVVATDFANEVLTSFRAMKQLNHFLNNAIRLIDEK